MSADRTSWIIMAVIFGGAILLIILSGFTPVGNWMVNP